MSARDATGHRSGHVTIRDVAAAAKVSQSTISRVLNGASTSVAISEETRRRIRAIADELGYRPNPFARGLAGRPIRLIGVMVRDVADPFMATIVSHLSAASHAMGYGILLGHARSSSQRALELHEVLDPRHCDGLILVGDLDDENILLEAVSSLNRSVVGLCLGQIAREITVVNVDNERGTLLALNHLLELGHSRIGFIEAGNIRGLHERRQEYTSFMRERGLDPNRYAVVAENNGLRGGYEAAKRLLVSPMRPTALFASWDILAIGAMKAAEDLGLRIPRDLSVVGFDDIELASYTVPGLTTLHQPVELLVERALERLLSSIGEKAGVLREPEVILVEPTLVVRASTAILEHEEINTHSLRR